MRKTAETVRFPSARFLAPWYPIARRHQLEETGKIRSTGELQPSEKREFVVEDAYNIPNTSQNIGGHFARIVDVGAGFSNRLIFQNFGRMPCNLGHQVMNNATKTMWIIPAHGATYWNCQTNVVRKA